MKRLLIWRVALVVALYAFAVFPLTAQNVTVRGVVQFADRLEKPRDFDPFGQTGFAHLWLQYD